MVVKMPIARKSARRNRNHSWRRVTILSILSLYVVCAVSTVVYVSEAPRDDSTAPVSATPPVPDLASPVTLASPTASAALSTIGQQNNGPGGQPAPGPTLTSEGDTSAQREADQIPIYHSIDFLSGYLTNLTYPILFDGQPWDNGSVDILRLQEPGGGTSYWDYWSNLQEWGIANHQWRDDQGNWHLYGTESSKDTLGRAVTAYVLVDRTGPGVMDRLWFTNDAVTAISNITNSSNPAELTEWGNLSKLGNLRILVDERVVFDGPIEAWFSGDAQALPPALRDILVWHYRLFGANGNVLPVPYQRQLKVYLYGGEKKPKWFMATGIKLPAGTRVQSYSPGDQSLDQIGELAHNVIHPEDFINSQPNTRYSMAAESNAPAKVVFGGSGTVAAMQVRIAKAYDPRDLTLTVRYGTRVGLSVPLLAFFTEPGQLVYHRSTPIGVVDVGDSNLFYSNLPMPYQDGISIELSTTRNRPIPIDWQIARQGTVFSTELRVLYTPFQKLQTYGPDYTVHLDGNGKLVGLVFDSQDQHYDQVPHIRTKDPNKDDIDKIVFAMGYLEGNLTMQDGSGNSRYYSGQEDWAEGGYYFNLGYTTPSGGGNRPFAGVFRYKGGANGYASFFRYFNDLSAFRFQNGLDLSFGHGTYRNNFPVSYSTVAFYYVALPGLAPVTLPASEYSTVPTPTP